MCSVPANAKSTLEGYRAPNEHAFWGTYYTSRQGAYPFTVGFTEEPTAYWYKPLETQKDFILQESAGEEIFIFVPQWKLRHINMLTTIPWLQSYRGAPGREASAKALDLETYSQWIATRPVIQVSKLRRMLRYASRIPALHWGGVMLALFLIVAGLCAGPVMLTIAGAGLAATVAASLWDMNRS